MINRERLLEITELKLTEKIAQMDAGKYNNYVQLLSSFIDNFPRLEEKVKSALQTMDNDSLSKHLSSLRDMLEKIYAAELAEICNKQIGALGSITHEKLEAGIGSFLSSLSMLSIDIQMAEMREVAAKDKDDAIEKNSILAVDDTPFFLSVLKSALRNTEYKITCVTSAIDALTFLGKHRPALMLLDIEMAEMNGFKLAGKIREIGQKAPIVFLTGNSKKDNVTRALEVGAVDFIVKPINKEDIIARIGKHMAN